MIVLITGSRGWMDAVSIRAALIEYRSLARARGQELIIVHGDAPSGADRLADREARDLGLRVICEPAEWKFYGRRAGPVRNQRMLAEHDVDVVLAFRSSGKSSGTDDMIAQAVQARVPVRRLDVQNMWHDYPVIQRNS